MATLNQSNWSFDLSRFPEALVSGSVGDIREVRQDHMTRSSITLLNGERVFLPENWCWLDEKLGMSPDSKSDVITRIGGNETVRVKQYSNKDYKKLLGELSIHGLDIGVLSKAHWQRGKDNIVAFGQPTKSEWILLYALHPTSEQLTQIKRLETRIRKGLGSYVN